MRNIFQNQSPDFAAEYLLNLLGDADSAIKCAVVIKSQIPMYIGALNPKWKFWDDTIKILHLNLKEEEQHSMLQNAYKKTERNF